MEEVVARGAAGSGGCLHALFSARSQDGGHIGDVGFLSLGQAQGCAGWSAGSSDGAQHLLWGLVLVPEPVPPARGFWPCPGPWNPAPVPTRIWYPKTLCPAARPPISLVLHKAPSLSSALTPSLHHEPAWGFLPLHTPWGPSSCLPREAGGMLLVPVASHPSVYGNGGGYLPTASPEPLPASLEILRQGSAGMGQGLRLLCPLSPHCP